MTLPDRPRDQRQRGNDYALLLFLILAVALISGAMAAVAGFWTPPGWSP